MCDGVTVTPRPLFTSRKDPVPIVQEVGWAPGPVGQVRKISPLPGFDPRTAQPVASRYTDYATRPTIYTYTYLLTYQWCIVLQKLTGLKLVKKFPAFHGTRRFITALTSVRQLSLSWASPIQSINPHPTSWRSILILSTHLRLGLPTGLLPSGFPTKTLYSPTLLIHTRHMPSPSHSSRFHHPHNIDTHTHICVYS